MVCQLAICRGASLEAAASAALLAFPFLMHIASTVVIAAADQEASPLK